MILSRGKTDSASSRHVASGGSMQQQRKPAAPATLEDFIIKRDYTGARAFLEYAHDEPEDEEEGKKQDNEQQQRQIDQWIAYCNFHLGDYQQALTQYQDIKQHQEPHVESHLQLNVAVCMFYLGLYEEAKQLIESTPNTPLKQRLLFHLAHKLGDDQQWAQLLEELLSAPSVEQQLSLASMHYMRAHYQEAIDVYKRVLVDNKDFMAINVYLALCFYKLDYYDMSQEVLEVYLSQHGDSTIAINLKACNRFRLFSGRVAEQEIKNISDNDTFGADLIRHNLVVFRNGEGALRVLPGLLNIVPEARLNLAIYHLKQGDIQEAHALMKELQPTSPHEYILKGVVHAALGQQLGSKEHIKTAQQNLHLVGSSATECDTIPGRQSMASAFFLYEQFEEVLVYMNSIRSYFVNDDVFNYNFAQAKCATGYYKEAEELLMQISDMDIKNQHTYCMILAKCHIHCAHPELAWNVFITRDTNAEAFLLLQLIANECYRCEEFWVAAKAFDMLEKLDPSPENWEGKRGACAGVLFALATKAHRGRPGGGISEVIGLLRESSNSQAESMIKTVRKHISSFK
ncbi:LOW QUALITY PROTEIN: intraflagellar transport protein 56 [Drosophila sulfurigaster albostrigata]|uniref:Intraflagellar transport protein 56 n=1 Tax=Drosophila albomicans TaxID=7291 RepID=A0A6P8XU95_DROAB|nr:intraflagellar transport protein 56 [Drosophila albomicans]XP_062126037.1 LOW QUALITY PROTEIN: intraflagellar transport protein 56 [Drosophila sulfurigaster albostrigata]